MTSNCYKTISIFLFAHITDIFNHSTLLPNHRELTLSTASSRAAQLNNGQITNHQTANITTMPILSNSGILLVIVTHFPAKEATFRVSHKIVA